MPKASTDVAEGDVVSANGNKSEKNKVSLADLAYYFDAVERDRLDLSGRSRKSSEILALRDTFLKLPDARFEATLKTVKGLLQEEVPAAEAARQNAQSRRDLGRQLFDQLGQGGGSGASRVDKITST